MKWVKANDRMPDMAFSVNLKIDGRPGFGKFYVSREDKIELGFEATNGFGTLFHYQFDNVEWLDESDILIEINPLPSQ